MQKFKSVDELVNQLKPEKPIYCIRKKSIHLASTYFKINFLVKFYTLLKPIHILEVIKNNY